MNTDYEELLRNAVAALPENTADTRAAVYGRARAAMRAHVEAAGDNLGPAQAEAIEDGLEESIARVEARQPRDSVDFPVTVPRRGLSPLVPVGIAAVLFAGAAFAFVNYSGLVPAARPSVASAPEQVPDAAPVPVPDVPAREVTVERAPAEAPAAPSVPLPGPVEPVPEPVATPAQPDAVESPAPETPSAGTLVPVPGARSSVFEREAGSGSTSWPGGTVWTVSEAGTEVVGHAEFPDADLTVDLVLRRNTDASLPSDFVMEVTYSGGRVTDMEGVLVKDEELVPGVPLTAAVARVTDNTYLAAFNDNAPGNAGDITFTESRWVDLAVKYEGGELAVVSLGKETGDVATFVSVLGPPS